VSLARATIEAALAALAALSRRLQAQGVTAELCIFGGAAMVLAFDAREATRDVDAVFVPTDVIRRAAAEVAQELSLPEDWLNDGVKGFVSANQDYVSDGMPKDLPNLRVLRPSASYLLAMKCMAARVGDQDMRGDRDDVEFLVRHLHLQTAEQVLELITQYYPVERLHVKTRFFVEELMSTIRP
jgi:bifunctional pyridoxal-dependent enzyme with beta-cystathionase and maltose regulon repressor activities